MILVFLAFLDVLGKPMFQVLLVSLVYQEFLAYPVFLDGLDGSGDLDKPMFLLFQEYQKLLEYLVFLDGKVLLV